MALVSSARLPLGNLPVNTFGTPTKSTMHRKRSSDAMDSEACSPIDNRAAKRMATSPKHVGSRMNLSGAASPSPKKALTAEKYPLATSPPSPETMDLDTSLEYSNLASTASSIIGGDPDETMASQLTAATDVTPGRPSAIRERVERLRLRLQLAQYKVLTNQTHTPFAQLRLPTDTSDDTSRQQTTHEATEDREPSLPHMLPGRPTRPSELLSERTVRAHLASSPPRRSHGDDEDHDDSEGDEGVFRTPAIPRHRRNMHGPSRGYGQGGEEGEEEGPEEENLTSSVIKGKAAIGLLGLRGDH